MLSDASELDLKCCVVEVKLHVDEKLVFFIVLGILEIKRYHSMVPRPK